MRRHFSEKIKKKKRFLAKNFKMAAEFKMEAKSSFSSKIYKINFS
jgi:hypothetical protein